MKATRSNISLATLAALLIHLLSSLGADTETVVSASTPDALVQSALRAELEGDLSRRTELLHNALEQDNNHPPTNWQLGYLRWPTGDWLSVPQHQELNSIDPTLMEYRAFREKLFDAPDADWKLAEWCTRHHVEDVAAVHYSRTMIGQRGGRPCDVWGCSFIKERC
jgi:hypothetical protein